jgi:hypothetical protein
MKKGSMVHLSKKKYPIVCIGLSILATVFIALAFLVGASPCRAAESSGLPAYLSDRGDGIPTSLFGTYIREKKILLYLFYEYTRISNFEYSPKELGYPGEQEFFGEVDEHEALVFFAYAFNDSFALEFESALYSSVDFKKSSDDTTAVPDKITESGLGDTEINLRWRYLKETASRPEFTFFFKTVFPFQEDKKLIGTQNWEFEPGIVLTKGFSIGTFAARVSVAYDTGGDLDLGEWAIDYVKRLNPSWRGVLSLHAQQERGTETKLRLWIDAKGAGLCTGDRCAVQILTDARKTK